MKILMVTGENISDTSLEILMQLGHVRVHQYVYSNEKFLNDVDFENDQKYFDCLYSPDPDILLKVKPKIPYIYDIPSGRFQQELNFRIFDNSCSSFNLPSHIGPALLKKSCCFRTLSVSVLLFLHSKKTRI